jgi:ParB-like chromosome segregation protein Spo0J
MMKFLERAINKDILYKDMIRLINGRGFQVAPIQSFKPIQNILKKLSIENYKRLKNSIEKYGYFIPIFIWNGYILDGSGRREVIINEGWELEVTYINIDAQDIDEAKNKLLEIKKQYNNSTYDGLQFYSIDKEPWR